MYLFTLFTGYNYLYIVTDAFAQQRMAGQPGWAETFNPLEYATSFPF